MQNRIALVLWARLCTGPVVGVVRGWPVKLNRTCATHESDLTLEVATVLLVLVHTKSVTGHLTMGGHTIMS